MQPVSNVTPNECIVTLNNKQSQQSYHFELLPKCAWVRRASKPTADAENGAGQSGLNWPCFDHRLEVATSSTFLLTL